MRQQGASYSRITWADQHGRRARVGRRPQAHRHHFGSSYAGVFIALLYLLFSTGVATATVHVIRGRSTPPALLANVVPVPRYLVLIVLDGARPDYFGLTPLPHVDALRAQGMQFTNAMDGILETETPAGHTTIATGSTPARNGILGFDWAQNDNDYSLFSPDIVRAGAMEHIMENANVPTIAGLYKARFPRARVVALSGHKYYAADPLGGPAADAIMYYQGDAQGRYIPVAIPGHVPPAGVLNDPGLVYPTIHLGYGVEDTLATKLALATFHKMRQRITLINYPEFDWPLGHVDGGSLNPSRVITLMKNFDRDLGMIEDAYRKAGVLKQTLFVITADHGMQQVKRFIPETVISNAVSQAGTTAPDIAYNTGAYIWLANAAKAQTVAENVIATKDSGIQSVYYETGAGRTAHYVLAGGTVSPDADAANQYLLKTLINGHEPDVVVFSREGQSFSSPSANWKGDHGASNWQSQHIPLIFSGPGIRSGSTDAPAQLEDIAPTALSVMGVRPTGMQGHILSDALLTSGSAAQKARSAEISQITPVTQALTAQDNAETNQ